MIELSQPAQCLFCPQRRRIALIMKIVLAVSAALIVGILLFLRAWQRESSASPAVARTAERAASMVPNQSGASLADTGGPGLLTDQGRERLQRQRRQGNEVQAKLNGLLKNGSPNLDGSRRLLRGRLKELLMQKVLLLGEYAGNPREARAAERKQVLSAVDRELELLEEQLALLNRTAARN